MNSVNLSVTAHDAVPLSDPASHTNIGIAMTLSFVCIPDGLEVSTNPVASSNDGMPDGSSVLSSDATVAVANVSTIADSVPDAMVVSSDPASTVANVSIMADPVLDGLVVSSNPSAAAPNTMCWFLHLEGLKLCVHEYFYTFLPVSSECKIFALGGSQNYPYRYVHSLIIHMPLLALIQNQEYLLKTNIC